MKFRPPLPNYSPLIKGARGLLQLVILSAAKDLPIILSSLRKQGSRAISMDPVILSEAKDLKE